MTEASRNLMKHPETVRNIEQAVRTIVSERSGFAVRFEESGVLLSEARRFAARGIVPRGRGRLPRTRTGRKPE